MFSGFKDLANFAAVRCGLTGAKRLCLPCVGGFRIGLRFSLPAISGWRRIMISVATTMVRQVRQNAIQPMGPSWFSVVRKIHSEAPLRL